MTDFLTILKSLVAMPSDRTTPGVEAGVATFLRDLLARDFPWLTVETQVVEGDRVNIFVHDGTPVSLLLMGHMDVVEDGAGWTVNICGEEKDGKLYGRGAADMKAGIVAILSALAHAHATGKAGVAALFYADEEYEFKGMRRFLEDYRLSPSLVVCPEPTQGALRPGCRGVVECRAVLRGKRGHAARPLTGVSAFRAMTAGVAALDEKLAAVRDEFLGAPSLNIAHMTCGSHMGSDEQGTLRLSDAGNVIPDYCSAVIEVRTVPGVDEADIREAFTAGVESTGATVETWDVALRLGSFMTPTAQLGIAEAAQREAFGDVVYEDPAKGGYSDAAMIAEAWGVPVVVWGPIGGGMHGVDEWVDLASVATLSTAFAKLVDKS